jgi:hypothetical protein
MDHVKESHRNGREDRDTSTGPEVKLTSTPGASPARRSLNHRSATGTVAPLARNLIARTTSSSFTTVTPEVTQLPFQFLRLHPPSDTTNGSHNLLFAEDMSSVDVEMDKFVQTGSHTKENGTFACSCWAPYCSFNAGAGTILRLP